MTDAEIARVPECYPLNNLGQCAVFPDSMALPIGSEVVGTIVAGDYMLRNDVLVLRILQTSVGDRPIYFASTTGTYEKFSVQPWMIRQGVAYKLSPTYLEPTASLVPLPPQARFQASRMFPFWVDVERTRALLEDHYVFRNLMERSFWPDLSTNGIPLQYYQAYQNLATGYLMLNQLEPSNEAIEKARKFVEVALGPLEVPAPAPADIPPQVEPVPDTAGESP
jgi:hypothetical protein